MRKKSLLAVAVSAAALAGVSAAPAFTGEGMGPPGTPGVAGSASGHHPAVTNALASGCARPNGLNDMNPAQGQI